MPRALVTTQLRENYGAHDWDGEGACPQYWKIKGCYEYVVTLPPANLLPQPPEFQEVLDVLANAVAYANDHASEHVVDRRILADGEATPEEAYFEDLLAQGIAEESDRKMYAPTSLTLDEATTAAAKRVAAASNTTTEEKSHVDA